MNPNDPNQPPQTPPQPGEQPAQPAAAPTPPQPAPQQPTATPGAPMPPAGAPMQPQQPGAMPGQPMPQPAMGGSGGNKKGLMIGIVAGAVVIVLGAVAAILLLGGGSSVNLSDTETIEVNDVSFAIPAGWSEVEIEGETFYSTDDTVDDNQIVISIQSEDSGFDGLVGLLKGEYENEDEMLEEFLAEFDTGIFQDNEEFTGEVIEYSDDRIIIDATGKGTPNEGDLPFEEANLTFRIIYTNDGVIAGYMVAYDSALKVSESDIKALFESIEI